MSPRRGEWRIAIATDTDTDTELIARGAAHIIDAVTARRTAEQPMSTGSYTSPSTGRSIRAVVFDTFGTLVDWRTGIIDAFHRYAHRNTLTLDAGGLADTWRAQYQPSMAPIRSGHRSYVPLDTLHRESLVRVLADAHHPTRTDDLDDLVAAWHHLPAWPDVPEALRSLRQSYPISPLSNAHTALLIELSRHNHIDWDMIIGSDIAETYKPEPRAYLAAAALHGIHPGEVLLVAAHNDDLAGARAAGLATGFLRRPLEHGPGQTTDLTPDAQWDLSADTLPDLVRTLEPS